MTGVFDIGRTNKKFLVFDQDWHVVFETSEQLPEIKDEDGFPCDDIRELERWVKETFAEAIHHPDFELTGINAAAYGASWVHLDQSGTPLTPLYSYLKPYPEELLEKFYREYGPKETFCARTASPPLGMLNSGLQLYWLKHDQPEVFASIRFSLHLPQYISWLLSGMKANEMTSLGCHTGMWDFTQNRLHQWVETEEISLKLPPVVRTSFSRNIRIGDRDLRIGTGIHDSSAALVPYLKNLDRPFMLMSTGTWSITLNPYYKGRITEDDLRRDVLNYLTFEGGPVRASRLFMGNEYDFQLRRLCGYFGKTREAEKEVEWDEEIMTGYRQGKDQTKKLVTGTMAGTGPFPDLQDGEWNLTGFQSFEEAYHRLLWDLSEMQMACIRLAGGDFPPDQLHIDGGFARNPIFVRLMQEKFSGEVHTADIPQATALGAAMAMM